MEKVSVNKGLLAGVVAVAGASLLAVAFLLGRASGSAGPAAEGRGRTTPGEPASAAAALRAPEQALPAPTAATFVPEPAPFPGSAPAPVAPEPAPPQPRGEAPAPAVEPFRGAPDPERAAVAAYLAAVERVQPGNAGGDPESVANEMAAALAKGDTSGLDGMIRDTEAAKGRLAALAPPAPCAAHHRESLASLDDALGMLRALKGAMESPDPAARLTAVAAQATTLRSRAEALQREETALRERYGLPR